MGISPLLETKELILKRTRSGYKSHYDIEDKGATKLGIADTDDYWDGNWEIRDGSGSIVFYVKRELERRYNAYVNNILDTSYYILATIRHVGVIHEDYEVLRGDVEFMHIRGDVSGHDYKMLVNGVEVASTQKKWASIRDAFGASITGDVDHRVIIGSIIAIEDYIDHRPRPAMRP